MSSTTPSEEPNDPGSDDRSPSSHPQEDPQESHRGIRAAKVSVDRTGHGVTMTITAGKLRLRLYIEAQWNDLIRKISAGEGELDQLVPFRMAPFEVGEEAELVSASTIDAQPIPGLSDADALQGTPLWNASFPPEEPEG